MSLATDTYPKDIVLFSDGTGKSASKPFKTNVWRTYQALDLHAPGPDGRMQVAFYRDGVGTETFKPLAILGGAFGFGVMHDVRELYTFLCRNYREGDRIYGFGFSRGAFTIRLLVGFVAACGLVPANDENELRRHMQVAFKAFRKHFRYRAAQTRKAIYRPFCRPPRYRGDPADGQIELEFDVLRPQIEFLGLWDTVDAYGMPIDELKEGIDRWLYPMGLPDRRLSPIVEHACHALSLDDERSTFRPLLWDETRPDDQGRIEQVWFAGVHANVGGGYPIDDLSLVPLVWMLGRAHGLRFLKDQVDYFTEMQNVHGTAYDSRSGVAGYYRYGPRSLEKLCADPVNEVWIASPKVHPSVAERISYGHRAYAPISLPRGLALTNPTTRVPVTQHGAFVDLAWDAVFWRRITYFATVFLSVLLLVAPFARQAPSVAPCRCAKGEAGTWLDWAVDKLLSLAPSWSQVWIDAYRAYPLIATPLVVLLGWLFFVQSDKMQRHIFDRSEWAWASMKGKGTVQAHATPWTDRLIRAVRTSPAANRLGELYHRTLIPNLFGLLVWALIFFILYKVVYGAYAYLTWLARHIGAM